MKHVRRYPFFEKIIPNLRDEEKVLQLQIKQ